MNDEENAYTHDRSRANVAPPPYLLSSTPICTDLPFMELKPLAGSLAMFDVNTKCGS